MRTADASGATVSSGREAHSPSRCPRQLTPLKSRRPSRQRSLDLHSLDLWIQGWVAQLQRIEGVGDLPADEEVAGVLVIRGNYVPRRPFSAALFDRLLIGGGVF